MRSWTAAVAGDASRVCTWMTNAVAMTPPRLGLGKSGPGSEELGGKGRGRYGCYKAESLLINANILMLINVSFSRLMQGSKLKLYTAIKASYNKHGQVSSFILCSYQM